MSESGLSEHQIRLALIQQMESLRRSGVTHWKRIAPVVSPIREAIPAAKSLDSEAVLASPKPAAEVPSLKEILLSNTATRTDQNPPQQQSVAHRSEEARPVGSTRPPFQPFNLSLEDRIIGLKQLAEQVRQCTRCHELASTRTQTVFGVGNPQARILFVGEAPGADEDAKGEPFVGKAGQLLNDIIKACRLRREDIYICNVLRCRPPGNRLPAPDECANCREYLDGQIAHVNPEYIVCWGACAAQNLLSSTESIGKLRRRFFSYGTSKVLCTYHPSYLLRNPSAKKDVWEDMKMLFEDMGIDLTKKA